jgi:hypothetical protein
MTKSARRTFVSTATALCAAAACAGLAALAGVSSCLLFVGSTSGYQAEAGAPSPACTSDAGDASCVGLVLDCDNCYDAGQICCVIVTSSSSVVTMCSSSPCTGPLAVQACQTSGECGSDGGTCLKQTCTLNGSTSVVGLCASVPGYCTPQ